MKESEAVVTDEMVKETDHFWENPRNIMNLIDLLFLYEDPDKEKTVS